MKVYAFFFTLPESSSAKHKRKLQICVSVNTHMVWLSNIKIQKWGVLGCHRERHAGARVSEQGGKKRVNFIEVIACIYFKCKFFI